MKQKNHEQAFTLGQLFNERKFLISRKLNCSLSLIRVETDRRSYAKCTLPSGPYLKPFSTHNMLHGERNVIFSSLLEFQKKTSNWLPTHAQEFNLKPFLKGK